MCVNYFQRNLKFNYCTQRQVMKPLTTDLKLTFTRKLQGIFFFFLLILDIFLRLCSWKLQIIYYVFNRIDLIWYLYDIYCWYVWDILLYDIVLVPIWYTVYTIYTVYMVCDIIVNISIIILCRCLLFPIIMEIALSYLDNELESWSNISSYQTSLQRD